MAKLSACTLSKICPLEERSCSKCSKKISLGFRSARYVLEKSCARARSARTFYARNARSALGMEHKKSIILDELYISWVPNLLKFCLTNCFWWKRLFSTNQMAGNSKTVSLLRKFKNSLFAQWANFLEQRDCFRISCHLIGWKQSLSVRLLKCIKSQNLKSLGTVLINTIGGMFVLSQICC